MDFAITDDDGGKISCLFALQKFSSASKKSDSIIYSFQRFVTAEKKKKLWRWYSMILDVCRIFAILESDYLGGHFHCMKVSI